MITLNDVLQETENHQMAEAILSDYEKVLASKRFIDTSTFVVEDGDTLHGYLTDHEKTLHTLSCGYKEDVVCFFKSIPKDKYGNVMLTPVGRVYVDIIISKIVGTLQLFRKSVLKRIEIPSDKVAVVQGKNFSIISKAKLPEIKIKFVINVSSASDIFGECISEAIH